MRGKYSRWVAALLLAGAALPALAASYVQDSSSGFAGGTFADTEDAGSGSSPAIQIVHNTPFGFGDGHDGSATISGDPNSRASCSGSQGSTTLNTTLGAAIGDVILIHQSRGTGAGAWEINRVLGTGSNQLVLAGALSATYTDSGNSQAQAVLVPQYSSLTISGGSPAAWNGDTGGIYAVMCSGTVTVSGSLSVASRGFRAGWAVSGDTWGIAGEGHTAPQTTTYAANGSGGGGGIRHLGTGTCNPDGGGGGGNASNGQNAQNHSNACNNTAGGVATSNSTLTNAVFGGGGGGGGGKKDSTSGAGGVGGGFGIIIARQITVNATCSAAGANGAGSGSESGGGGGGAGGNWLFRGHTLNLGSGRVTAPGGSGGYGGHSNGGSGSSGRICAEYGSGGFTGTTSPTANTVSLALKTAGTYRSPAIRLAGCQSLGTMEWTATGGTSVRVRTRTAGASCLLDDANFSGWLSSSGSQITSPTGQWIQYEMELTGTTTSTPSVSRVAINYDDTPPAVSRVIIHDTAADFAGGTFTDTLNGGAADDPAIRIVSDLPFNLGDGRNGSATISGDPNTRASCSGTIGSSTLTTALNAAAGDIILIHQTRGSGSGNWEFNKVVSDNGATLTLVNGLTYGYVEDGGNSQAQALLVPQYSSLTISGGGPAAWNGDTGGIYAVMCSGTINVTGTLSLSGKGFRGGWAVSGDSWGISGEGHLTPQQQTYSANGNGGGGGIRHLGTGTCNPDSGGGGGHAYAGTNAVVAGNACNGTIGGLSVGTDTMTTAYLGGGGGGGGGKASWPASGAGGIGGGLAFILGKSVNVTGTCIAGGNNGASISGEAGGGGGGAGGAIYIKGESLSVGVNRITALGGSGGTGGFSYGGPGSVGRVRLEYGQSVTGITNPAASNSRIPLRTAGTYLSAPINVPGLTTWGSITWISCGGTGITFRTRTAATEALLSSAPWSDTYTASGSAITSPAADWIQYEATLTGTTSESPSLRSVSITYDVPSVPADLRPNDGHVINTTHPTFTWSPSVDPRGEPLQYRITIDNNADLSSPFINESLTTTSGQDTFYNYTGSSIGNGGTYYWRVKVTNTTDTVYSPIQRFSVDTTLLGSAVQQVTSSDFATGSLTGLEDVGSGAAPAIRLKYDLPFLLGDGHDGVQTISGDPNARASCTGTSGTTTLTTTLDAAPGDIVLIQQSRGTGAGNWELNQVVTDNGSTLTLLDNLSNTYTDSGSSQAQAVLVPQYSALTISGGGPVAWDGNTGGVYAVMCSGTVNITGSLSLSGRGYRPGWSVSGDTQGITGEGTTGDRVQTTGANGNGGGGGARHYNGVCNPDGGGGGGNAGNGANPASHSNSCKYTVGGTASGNAGLTVATFGGGGGSGGGKVNHAASGAGGTGGGFGIIIARSIAVSGGSAANSGTNGASSGSESGGGGGGAGGSWLLQSVSASIGSNAFTATAGSGGSGGHSNGGAGSVGRIRVQTAGNLSGSTNPTASTATTPFLAAGTYLSAPINVPGISEWGTLQWTATGGNPLSFRTRTAASAEELSTAQWSTELTTTGSAITSPALPWIQYEASYDGTGNVTASLSKVVINYLAEPPTITQQPLDSAVCLGDDAEFTVLAIGTGTLSYQWQKDGVDLADGDDYVGTSTVVLSITDVDGDLLGAYRCLIGNANGTTTSDTAALTLNSPTAVTVQPQSQHICTGDPATFTLTASGTGQLSYQWRKDGTPLSDGGHVSGATTATLQISNADAGDIASYDCVVTADCGTATSNSVTLSLNVDPIIVGAETLDLLVTRNSSCPATENQIVFSANDADDDITGWSFVGTPPSKGTVSFVGSTSGSTATACYQPAAGQLGTDSYTVQVTDSCGQYDQVTVTVNIAESPSITAWQSIAVTPLPIALDPNLTGDGTSAPVVESRHTDIGRLIVNFSLPVRGTDGVFDPQTLAVIDDLGQQRVPTTATLINDDRQLELTFSPPLANGRRHTVDLTGRFQRRQSPHLELVGSTVCQVRVLVGDVTGNGEVNLADVAAIRSFNRAAVSESNARYDVNGDGAINLIDMALTRVRTGNIAP